MKQIAVILLSSLLVISCSHKQAAAPVAEKKEWIRISDEIATRYSKDFATLAPEGASWMGYTEFDAKTAPLDNTYPDRILALNTKWVGIVDDELKKDYPLETKEDLQILRTYLLIQIMMQKLYDENGVLDLDEVSKSVFMSLQSITSPQVAKERHTKAVDRFKSYVRGFGSYKPYAIASQEFFEHLVQKYKGKKAIYPSKKEVELYLKESPQYVAGVEQILQATGRTDWKEDYELFKQQIATYDAFVKKEILPKSRPDSRLPRVIYATRLKAMGMDVSPEELIAMGEKGYRELYPQYQSMAKKLAKKYKLKSTKPADVVAFFKKKQIVKAEDVHALYASADARLQDIIETQKIVTLPKQGLVIRMAGEAESLAQPVPHLNPPNFIGNKGERPEFVAPTAKDKMPFDDFSHEFVAMGLLAHEGRPGHDLQFGRMIDIGVSMTRAIYAMNSVNAEGWGLYAEDLVYPYLKEEEQFFAIQMRLWRMARMFLDPQIQLGLINDQRVIDVFTKELGVSKEMATLELRRYTFMSAGQAPAYYYGYLLLRKARAEAEKTQGAKFSLQCFNDQILSYGLLPLSMIIEKVQQDGGKQCLSTNPQTAAQ